LSQKEAMYAYSFEERKYDAGDNRCCLEATVEFALKEMICVKVFRLFS
jgi:UTP--glucose-1-phosphate uridylyltransferase